MISQYIEVLILAFIQGFSEFIPVSSSGHLIIVSEIFNFNISSLQLDISFHLGSLFAIIFYFRKDLLNITKHKKVPSSRPGQKYYDIKIVKKKKDHKIRRRKGHQD